MNREKKLQTEQDAEVFHPFFNICMRNTFEKALDNRVFL